MQEAVRCRLHNISYTTRLIVVSIPIILSIGPFYVTAFYYEYNNANLLSRVRDGGPDGTILEEYWYDASDVLTIKKVYTDTVNTTIIYVSKEFEVIQYTNGTSISISYYYANGERVASKDNSTEQITYYHQDHLKSNTILTNASGDKIDEVRYYPYGKIESGGENTRYGYNDKELDWLLGQLDYGGRHYNPETMHWTQPDPNIPDSYNPQALNRYSYTYNNPIKYVDPTGNEPNLAEAGNVGNLISFVRSVEAAHPGLNAKQTLALISQQYAVKDKTFGGLIQSTYNIETDKSSQYEQMYVHTEKEGWTDAWHFFTAADVSSEHGYYETMALGYLEEAAQFILVPGSGFSYEDLPTDSSGAQFGENLNNEKALSDQMEAYFGSLSPTDKENAPNYDQLTSEDPHEGDYWSRPSKFTFLHWRVNYGKPKEKWEDKE